MQKLNNHTNNLFHFHFYFRKSPKQHFRFFVDFVKLRMKSQLQIWTCKMSFKLSLNTELFFVSYFRANLWNSHFIHARSFTIVSLLKRSNEYMFHLFWIFHILLLFSICVYVAATVCQIIRGIVKRTSKWDRSAFSQRTSEIIFTRSNFIYDFNNNNSQMPRNHHFIGLWVH